MVYSAMQSVWVLEKSHVHETKDLSVFMQVKRPPAATTINPKDIPLLDPNTDGYTTRGWPCRRALRPVHHNIVREKMSPMEEQAFHGASTSTSLVASMFYWNTIL